jgi:IS5 family transposase
MRQITFACQPSFEKYARASRREQFLQTMETVVPWSELEASIEPYYPKAGMCISTGMIVDATIIAAPSSTKNIKKERDPQMHQTRKGNQYYFGAKAHIGVDSNSGVVHSVCTSAAIKGKRR